MLLRYHLNPLTLRLLRIAAKSPGIGSVCPQCTRLRNRRAWASVRAVSDSAKGPDVLPGPLSQRPRTYLERRDDLLAWYASAVEETKVAVASQTEADDPGLDSLLRDLNWLLEDVVGAEWQLCKSGGSSQPRLNLAIPRRQLEELWYRRLHDREPLQYLTHAAHWRDLVLAVGPGALIPRPETERLIDFAVEARGKSPLVRKGVWVDLGTGSGAVAIGLARALPDIHQVWAVDQSKTACDWAAHNSRRYGCDDRIQIREGSWFAPLQHLKGRVSGIISNPPYIEREIIPTLQAEVRDHEPISALDGGGGEGLDCLAHICSQAARFLRPGGFLALETGGPHQTVRVQELLSREFRTIQRRKDVYGVERFVTATRD